MNMVWNYRARKTCFCRCEIYAARSGWQPQQFVCLFLAIELIGPGGTKESSTLHTNNTWRLSFDTCFSRKLVRNGMYFRAAHVFLVTHATRYNWKNHCAPAAQLWKELKSSRLKKTGKHKSPVVCRTTWLDHAVVMMATATATASNDDNGYNVDNNSEYGDRNESSNDYA